MSACLVGSRWLCWQLHFVLRDSGEAQRSSSRPFCFHRSNALLRFCSRVSLSIRVGWNLLFGVYSVRCTRFSPFLAPFAWIKGFPLFYLNVMHYVFYHFMIIIKVAGKSKVLGGEPLSRSSPQFRKRNSLSRLRISCLAVGFCFYLVYFIKPLEAAFGADVLAPHGPSTSALSVCPGLRDTLRLRHTPESLARARLLLSASPFLCLDTYCFQE